MIDNVVSSIIEAENRAKEMVAEAEKKASVLLTDTDNRIEEANRKAAIDNKAYATAQLQQANLEAAKQAEDYFNAKKQEIEKEVNAFKKSLVSAIKIITEKVQ